MCFSTMSKTTKDLTATTVNLANTMAARAGKVFGAADQTFHTISSALTSIVNKGESQFGFSGGQFQALNAAAVNAGATQKRNLIAQAAASGQPFNAAAIDREVANNTATAENQIMQAGYKQGNENWQFATKGLEAAPSIYGTADEFGKTALGGLNQAMTAQGNRDAAGGGGWKNLIKTGIGIAGNIGGSFIGDPNLGSQLTGAVGGGSGDLLSSATKMFGKSGSVWGNKSATGDESDLMSQIG